MTDPTAPLYEDPADADLEALAHLARQEAEALSALLAEAHGVQWRASPVPRPRDDTTERSKGLHGDPTASIALDARRLRVRAQVLASERVLRDAVVATRGVRLGMERALDRWAGRTREEEPTC